MTVASAFADDEVQMQKWFAEDTTSVTAALNASGQSTDGQWAAGESAVAGSLYVEDYVEGKKICVDTDRDSAVSYTPKAKVNGSKATVVLSGICFNAAVDLEGIDLDGVKAAVAIVPDGDDSYIFKVAKYEGSKMSWDTPETWESASPSATYDITCTFDYSKWTVTYTLGNADSVAYSLPPAEEGTDGKVSVAEFSGTCSFTSLSGEKQPVQFTLTLPPVVGIESYTIGETTQASGTWSLTEDSTPTVEITLAPGYFAKGTTATLPAITGNTSYTADQVTAMLELVQGEAKIGETYYRSLQVAADAVKDSETIVIQKNYTTTEPVMFTNKTAVILDLNGKTVEYTDKTYALRFFDTTITLTSSVDGGIYKKTGAGTLGLVGSARVTADHGGKTSQATVTINGGTWSCKSETGTSFKLEDGTVTLNAGVVTHELAAGSAFSVSTNASCEVSSVLNLVGGTVNGYVTFNEKATQKYTATSETKFSIQQNDICASGYEMVKGEDDFYTIQEKTGPTYYKLSLTLGDNVKQVIWAIDSEVIKTNTASETGIAIEDGKTVTIDEVTYALRYTRPAAEKDQKGSSKTVNGADIAFTFEAAELPESGELPSDVTPGEIGITEGAFKDATSAEVSKVNKWAIKSSTTVAELNAMTFTGATLTENEQSYLLNCSKGELETEKAEFKIESITFDENGKPVIPTGVTGKTYNGTIQTQGRQAIGSDEAGWHDKEDGDKFFRFKLVK